MPINFEVKGTLAKLLAAENLIVEHRNVETASFNVETRILTLPMLQNATSVVYDTLLQHESSHAIWSPNIDWTQDHDIPHSFVNIVEDARIEKLCKRKYPGSPKTFYRGYKELYEANFFQIENENVNELNLADRVNLYFKIGSFLSINFTSEEQEIVDEIAECESFDDVLNAAQRLYDYCKIEVNSGGSSSEGSVEVMVSYEISDDPQESMNQNSQESQNSQQSPSPQGSAESPQNTQGDEKSPEISQPGANGLVKAEKPKAESSDESESGASGSENAEDESSDESESGASGSENADESNDTKEPEAKTMENLERNLRSLSHMSEMREITYLEIPKVNLKTIIIPNSDIHSYIEQDMNQQLNRKAKNIFKESDESFFKFKAQSKTEVGYLIKEFECRKAADLHSRSRVSSSGTLNMSKLYSYRFNEELFNQITTIPEGKNHGLIFILDWSGSMGNYLQDTYKQLLNLVWFCRRLSIPFEVYAFTNQWRSAYYDYKTGKYVSAEFVSHYTPKTNHVSVDSSFSLLNILTSKTKNQELEKQLLNIWRLIDRNRNYSVPTKMQLSGTPLNESLVSLHQIIPQFKTQNRLQKVHCIILTDGDGANLMYHAKIKRSSGSTYEGISSALYDYSYIRDPKLGTNYKMEYDQSKTLLRHLKDCFPEVSFIGFRINSNGLQFLRKYYGENDKEYSKLLDSWNKNKSFAILNAGYHAYFSLSSSYLSRDSEFEVSDDASKNEIKKAFNKYIKNKKVNKKILGEFIRLIS